MPFPMVHFFAAEAAFANCGAAVDWPALFLGAIAPDAYKRRQGAGEAARRDAHLERADSSDWLRGILDYAADRAQAGDRWFFLGYAAHLLTDLFWRDEFFTPFLERYNAALETDFSSARAAYVADATAIELYLYRRCTFRDELWRALAAAEPVGVPGMVAAEEVAAERDLTLGWYGEATAPARVPGIICPDQADAFIARTAGRVAAHCAPWISPV